MKTQLSITSLALPLLAVLLSLSAVASAQDGEGRTTQEEQSEEVIRQVLYLINERNLDAAFELYAEDYIYHGPGGQELRGREGIRGLWEIFLDAFPDLHSTVDDLITEGDKLVLRWTIRGTHTGEFLGIPASNNPIELSITEIFRVADGQLREAWDCYDRLGMMQQIGAIPE